MRKAIFLIILCTIFTSIGQILLKLGAIRITSFASFFNVPLLLGLSSYVVGFVLMIAAFKKGQLSVLYPLLASAYIWVSLASPYFFPGEEFTTFKIIGISSIIIAVSLLGYGGNHG